MVNHRGLYLGPRPTLINESEIWVKLNFESQSMIETAKKNIKNNSNKK